MMLLPMKILMGLFVEAILFFALMNLMDLMTVIMEIMIV